MEQRMNYDKNKTHDFSFYNRFILEIENQTYSFLFCELPMVCNDNSKYMIIPVGPRRKDYSNFSPFFFFIYFLNLKHFLG